MLEQTTSPDNDLTPTATPAGGGLHRFGLVIHDYARWIVAAWVVVILLGFAGAAGALGGQGLFDRLKAGDSPLVPGESKIGQELIDASASTGPTVLLLIEDVDPAAPALRSALTAARTTLTALPGVAAVNDPFTPPATPSPFVAADGRSVLVVVTMRPDLTAESSRAAVAAADAELTALGASVQAALPGTRVEVGGLQKLVDEINTHVSEDLKTGEAIALPLSLLVMVLVFGGFLAAGLPIVGAIGSISGGLAMLLGFSYVIDLDSSVPSVVSVLGLGLCIDYGLLLVSRYREELRRLQEGSPALPLGQAASSSAGAVREALGYTLAAAGRTVIFSAITVAISLAGLMFFRATILRAVGAAGVSVVLVALVVAITLVPALLALAGERMIRPGLTHRVPGLNRLARRLGDVAPQEGVFSRLVTRVQRRPLVIMAGCLAVLFAAAVPAAGIKIIASDFTILPTTSVQRQLFQSLDDDFPVATNAPIVVVTRALPEQVQQWASTVVAGLPGVRSVDAPRSQGEGQDQVSVLGIRTVAPPGSAQAREVVDLVRENRPDFEVFVTGNLGLLTDFLGDIRERAPLAIGVVVLATFVLLFLMTGSLLVPLKALLMNAVSLGASFGVLVWVFQQGHLEGLLNFRSNGGIDQTVPALALAFAFGLSMDYEVFLLSRIKELRDAGASNDDAVRYGLQQSGRIITSAALIVVIVFAGFVAGQLLIIKQVGVALAVAVAVDATIVRILLVPSTMSLLGEWNWWAPAPLRRLHARFGLREG